MTGWGWPDRLPWVRTWRARRSRAEVLATARLWQQEERETARKLLLDAARQDDVRRNSGSWHAQPTVPLPRVDRALLTPGAEHRTRRNRRR
ncbi:hypothetical protein AB0368_35045 [Actinoplanes sp. NPDC051475]|uniref:hypothetical protein n=1 Tax=Actinoplanes sp. NPDC051475 TaxID=3157225 RepID=UPI00344D5094